MRSPLRWLAAAALLATASALPAQQAAAPAGPPMPNEGDMAPDFALPGATRYGLLRDSVRLSDYRGQTVVVWFFFKARTKG